MGTNIGQFIKELAEADKHTDKAHQELEQLIEPEEEDSEG